MLLGFRYYGFESFLSHVRADLRRCKLYFARSRQRLENTLGDPVEFLICGFDITVQHICDQENAAARMIKSNDNISEQVDPVWNMRALITLGARTHS